MASRPQNRPSRLMPSVVALLAMGALVPALDASRRDLERLPSVEFTDLLARPQALAGKEVRFHCQVAERTDLFDRLRSSFRPERYFAIAVWDDRAPLWLPEARAAVSTGLFLHKDRFSAETVEALRRFQQVEIAGIIKEVIEGEPQIEVLEIIPVSSPQAVTDQAVYHIERALALQDEARDLSEVHFAAALTTDLPLAQAVDVQVLRGRNLLALGEVSQALQVLSEAAARADQEVGRSKADQAILHTLLAKARGEARDHSGAVTSARRALELDPSVGEAYAVLGIGLAGLERYEEARRSCDNAVRLRPADAEVRWYLGRILTLQQRHDDAIEALKKAIDLTPKDHRIHLSIAEAYQGRGLKGGASAAQDLATALREVDITLRLKADLPEAQVLGGSIIEASQAIGGELNLSTGRVPATKALAEERYRKALELDGAYVPALVALGRALVAQDKIDDARTIVERLKAAKADTEAAALAALLPAPTQAMPSAPVPASAPQEAAANAATPEPLVPAPAVEAAPVAMETIPSTTDSVPLPAPEVGEPVASEPAVVPVVHDSAPIPNTP